MTTNAIPDVLRVAIIASVFQDVWLSLHYDSPGPLGAAELTEGGYRRMLVTFDPQTGLNRQSLAFPSLVPEFAGSQLTHIGVWTAPIDGDFLLGAPLDAPAMIIPGMTFQLPAGALTLDLGE